MPRIPTQPAHGLSLLLLSALTCAAGIAQADVYKYTDPQGRTQYTDKPLTLPAQRMNVQTHRTDTDEVAQRSADELKTLQATDKSKQTAQSTAAEKKEAAEMTAKDKADSCVKARERYTGYMSSLRLYKPGANGEREYLTDAEIDKARATAKQAMDELCQ